MDQSTMDTLNSLYKQSSQLTEELDSFNKSIEEQKHESDEAWTEWLDAERNIDYIKQNLTKGNYGFATDSVAEAILASKLSIEMELEKVNAQIHEIYDKNPIVMESPIAGEMNVPEIKEEPVKMDSTEKTFERDSISISYKTTTPITSSGSDDNYSVPAKYDYIQKAGTNDCWAMTISLLFKVLGVKISVDEIKKYRPTNISDKTLNALNNSIKSNDIVGIADMKQIFNDILGDSVTVKEQTVISTSSGQANNKDFINNVDEYLLDALSKGCPVSAIYGAHYTTITDVTTKNNEHIYTIQDPTSDHSETLTTKELYDRTLLTKSFNIQLLWVEKNK